MKRSPLRSKPIEVKTSVPVIRRRKCANCGENFRPFSSMVKWCGPECGAALAIKKLEKAQAKAVQDEKRKTRAQLEALKTIPQLKKEAQREFNRYIRARDRGRDCICCGKPLVFGEIGGAVDAGHYRSTGSADHLRFNEDNCHAQRSDCNRYGAGRAVDYRIGLLRRIGLARVEALEANNTGIKWTREMLRGIRDTYRAKAKELEKQ